MRISQTQIKSRNDTKKSFKKKKKNTKKRNILDSRNTNIKEGHTMSL